MMTDLSAVGPSLSSRLGEFWPSSWSLRPCQTRAYQQPNQTLERRRPTLGICQGEVYARTPLVEAVRRWPLIVRAPFAVSDSFSAARQRRTR
jgi:hypothetical protein